MDLCFFRHLICREKLARAQNHTAKLNEVFPKELHKIRSQSYKIDFATIFISLTQLFFDKFDSLETLPFPRHRFIKGVFIVLQIVCISLSNESILRTFWLRRSKTA